MTDITIAQLQKCAMVPFQQKRSGGDTMTRLDALANYDMSNLAEFFVTETGRIEAAGGDCVRLIKCIRRGGMLVPIVAIVTPFETLIGSGVREQAIEIFNQRQMHVMSS